MIRVRTLQPGDEELVEAFLAQHADTSMFMRSNLRAGGLLDEGKTFQATWAGAFDGDELVAVAAHAWNDSLVVQAPRALPEVVRHAVGSSGRQLRGIVGAWRQVVAARATLGLENHPTSLLSHDDLFALELAALAVPPALARGDVRVRLAGDADRERITRWRSAYRVELLGHRADDPDIDASSALELEPLLLQQSCFLLEAAGEPVAFSAFNARLPDCVQIGGVFTPPALRGRGYARAVVAGSLLAARAQGVVRSILFTGKENAFARRVYLALGYGVVGDFGMVLFAEPRPAPSGRA